MGYVPPPPPISENALPNTRLNVLRVADEGSRRKDRESVRMGMKKARKICCDVCKNKLKKLTGIDQCSVLKVGNEPHDYYGNSKNIYVVCQHRVPHKFSEIETVARKLGNVAKASGCSLANFNKAVSGMKK